jgi:hypothetical protein
MHNLRFTNPIDLAQSLSISLITFISLSPFSNRFYFKLLMCYVANSGRDRIRTCKAHSSAVFQTDFVASQFALP